MTRYEVTARMVLVAWATPPGQSVLMLCRAARIVA